MILVCIIQVYWNVNTQQVEHVHFILQRHHFGLGLRECYILYMFTLLFIHKCGIDWDSEFSLMSIHQQNRNRNNRNANNLGDQLQPQNDGYIFKGGAQITGRCMYDRSCLLDFCLHVLLYLVLF